MARDPRRCRHAADPAHVLLTRFAVQVVVLILAAAAMGGWTVLVRRLIADGVVEARVGTAPALAVVAAGPVASRGGDALGTLATVRPSTPAGPAYGEGPAPSTAPADRAGLTAADRIAGLLKATIPQRGRQRLIVVPGSAPAPGNGPVKRIRVEVEAGLPVDGAAFADFVMSTLNDPRGWGRGGRMTFARTSGAYDLRVVLASPDTSERLCVPLRTRGTVSCGVGRAAVLTLYRWVRATPDYGTDRTGYRRYLINHEVGHTLGHGHRTCPGAGRVAPVMMQQTKGLKGCRPNSWPYP